MQLIYEIRFPEFDYASRPQDLRSSHIPRDFPTVAQPFKFSLSKLNRDEKTGRLHYPCNRPATGIFLLSAIEAILTNKLFMPLDIKLEPEFDFGGDMAFGIIARLVAESTLDYQLIDQRRIPIRTGTQLTVSADYNFLSKAE